MIAMNIRMLQDNPHSAVWLEWSMQIFQIFAVVFLTSLTISPKTQKINRSFWSSVRNVLVFASYALNFLLHTFPFSPWNIKSTRVWPDVVCFQPGGGGFNINPCGEHLHLPVLTFVMKWLSMFQNTGHNTGLKSFQ